MGISRSKVLSVKSIMEIARPWRSDRTSLSVAEHAKIDDIAPTVIDSGGDATVVNTNGQLTGILTRQAVIDSADKQKRVQVQHFAMMLAHWNNLV